MLKNDEYKFNNDFLTISRKDLKKVQEGFCDKVCGITDCDELERCSNCPLDYDTDESLDKFISILEMREG